MSLWSQHFHQPTNILPYLICFCWKTSYLIYTVDSFTFNSCPAAGLSNTPIFPVRPITACLHLGRVDRTLALSLRAMLNSKITQKSHKTVKNMALNRVKRTLVYSERSWNKKAECDPVQCQLGTCASDNSQFPVLCTSTHDCKSTVSVDLEAANKLSE